jgi:hypothetical protein
MKVRERPNPFHRQPLGFVCHAPKATIEEQMRPIAPGTFNARDKSPLESDQKLEPNITGGLKPEMGLDVGFQEISITIVAGVIKTQ